MNKQADHIIDFENISFAYPGDKVLFQKLSMGIAPGTFYHVKGPSGSGLSVVALYVQSKPGSSKT
jgi:ABC-type multidrug transport system fused ATPase/permease subunit